MSDPVSIGALVAAALSIAGESILKAGVTEGVKDAYQVLKAKLSVWAAGDAEELEKSPNSKSRQAVIAERVDTLQVADQQELRKLAESLTRKLKEEPKAVGLDIGRIEALDMQLGNISVSGGVGARIQEVKVSGSFRADNIEVGSRLGKNKR